jgi:hypothetical protein
VPTRVLLEGPAIEPLLAQVRDEYGSSVRIISADKVRSGGFGGFFAKQHYELSVEVPDAEEREAPVRRPAAPPAAAADDGPQTLEQLLARAESRDRIVPEDPPPILGSGRGPALGGGRGGLGDLAAGRGAGMGDTEAAVGGTGRMPERGLSDPQTAFAELMANLDKAETYSRPSPKPKLPEPEDDATVRPFRPAQAQGTPVNASAGANAAVNGAKPITPPPVPSLAELMGGFGVDESAAPPHPAATRAAQSPAPPRTPAAAYGLAPSSPAPASLAETLGGLGLGPTPQMTVPVTVTSPAPGLHPHGPGPMGQQWDSVQRNLMRVGMPEELAAQITGGDTYAGVLSVLAARPAAPGIPDAPGEILVLAGSLDHALPIGRKLCEQAGLDQAHLLIGGPTAAGTGLHSSRVLGDPEAAKAKAEKLQNAEHAWIVVVDSTVGRTDPIWLTDMCDAIGATAVWAVVDATRKTGDTARHLRTLGDVEALVVHNVDLTSDPATVLGLEQPIVSLDGKPATPHSWAAMLCARIAADVVPMAALPRRPARRG